jgi:hypothetical protein
MSNGRNRKSAGRSGAGVTKGGSMPGAKAAEAPATAPRPPKRPVAHNRIELNPENPIPFERGGQAFAMFGGERYLPFLGNLDNFAHTLLEARLLSITQSACISTKTTYFVGQGIKIQNADADTPVDELWDAFTKRANAKRQSLNRVFEKGFESLQTFGNTPYEVVRGTTAGKKYVYIYCKDFLDCRLGEPDSNGIVNYALVSPLFRKDGMLTSFDKVKRIPIYRTDRANDQDNWLQDGKVERTIIWVKTEFAGYEHYGLPKSVPTLIYQLLEYGGARYTLDNLENGMVIGTAIFLTGSVSQDEADKMARTMVRRHTGHGRRGRTAFFASENGISDAKAVQLETHKDASYEKQNEICESKIIFGHEWDAVLAGLKHTSSLGKGGGYLKEIYEQKLKSVIIPGQQRMIEDTMPSIIEIMTNWLGAKWDKFTFGFEPIQLDNKTSEASTTVLGLNTFLDIIALVASGAYPITAAIKLVQARYGLSEQEAKDQLGDIKIIPGYVRTKPNGTAGSDNSSGNPSQDGSQQ